MSDRELAIAPIGEVCKALGHLPALIGLRYIPRRFRDAGVTTGTLKRMTSDGLLKYHSHSQAGRQVNYELTDHPAWSELRATYPPPPTGIAA